MNLVPDYKLHDEAIRFFRRIEENHKRYVNVAFLREIREDAYAEVDKYFLEISRT